MHGGHPVIISWLAVQPFVLLFLVVAAGYALGRLQFPSIGLGATYVDDPLTASTATGVALRTSRAAREYASSRRATAVTASSGAPPPAPNASRASGTAASGYAARPSNSNIDPTIWWKRSVIMKPVSGCAGYVSGHRTIPAPMP